MLTHTTRIGNRKASKSLVGGVVVDLAVGWVPVTLVCQFAALVALAAGVAWVAGLVVVVGNAAVVCRFVVAPLWLGARFGLPGERAREARRAVRVRLGVQS